MSKNGKAALAEAQVSNNASEQINFSSPYIVEVELTGVVPILFHSWNTESVEAKSAAAKNSKAKKTDDVESYVYRTSDGYLGIAGKCLHGAICEAAKFMQDPRSPRKSARDLCKAAIQVLDVTAPLLPKTKTWDYDDRQRVMVQRAAITRTRPAMKEGWKVKFEIQCVLPEYISPSTLNELIVNAGRVVGLCDYRPTYGRYQVTSFKVKDLL